MNNYVYAYAKYVYVKVGQSLDMGEDLDGDGIADSGSLDSAVISVHMLQNRILIGKICLYK